MFDDHDDFDDLESFYEDGYEEGYDEGFDEGFHHSHKSSSHHSGNTGGCYVATAVYGSYDCPEVWTLRRFRDQYLKQSALGRLFIKFYYATSPTLVSWFGDKKAFQIPTRSALNPFVAFLKGKGYSDTPYND